MVPLVLGWVLAVQDSGEWRVGRFLLVNLGAFMVHLATNLANDLFDHVLGADSGDAIGGSRVIQEGLISPHTLAAAIMALYSGAMAAAFIITSAAGRMDVWLLILFSGLSSFFYVAPPIKYGYRGLGEVSVFVNMGLIMVAGTYVIQAEAWRWAVLLYALPVSLMVANILFYQSLPDMPTDEAAGKYTLAVRLGKKGARTAFRIWWTATYLTLIMLYFTGLTGPLAWLSLLTVPIFLKTDRIIGAAQDWVELDKHGHLVRKLYLSNGSILIFSKIILN
jgi:1,4-dihydroxy-2-naphthoate octaprenyltransferase